MATASVGLLLRRQIFGKQFLGKKLYKPFDQIKATVILLNKFPNYSYSTQVQQYKDVTVSLRNGLPVVSVPLPSRRENCEFTLKPITHTVGDFLNFIQQEDGGIDRSAIYTSDGNRIAKSTTVDILMKNNFTLSINDQKYQVNPPELITTTHEDAETMDDVKTLVSQLYSALNIEQHQLQTEKELVAKLEDLKVQIEPLEKTKDELVQQSGQFTRGLIWVGCGFMAVQFGILARLTWWDYSWDIMEPVTYFITYGTSIAMFAYFVLCKHECNYGEVKDRQFLLKFYKEAQKKNFDIKKYNDLKNNIAIIESDIQRLRDPLQLHLPLQELKRIKG
ncbi:hypothetical protein LOTGIDRAFT_203141 [Lottia gigantea]|uniref:Calcium uniporter protein n=1 Tax=Lottia gigantea TaxID=225164 RepID=V3ZX85_LOTGI|nr:hypothetical protein LOTGIDRAFT_203141 [Lottia gigantea]ESO88982.1 hypothetical protein LOTGIDRAFT_203141 [Lottia gigantea]